MNDDQESELIALYDRVLALQPGIHLLTEHCLAEHYETRCRCGWFAREAKHRAAQLWVSQRAHLLDVVARHAPATDRPQ
jgi:hypothetical protein